MIQNGLAEHGTRSHGVKIEGDDEANIDLSLSDPIFAAILLHSLPSPDFNALRTSIFSDAANKLKSSRVYEQVANEVAANQSKPAPPSITALIAAEKAAQYPKRTRSHLQCAYCRRDGHEESACRKKAGKQIDDAVKAGLLVRDADGNISRRAAPVVPANVAVTTVDDPSVPLDLRGFTSAWAVAASVDAVSLSSPPSASFYLDSGAGASMVNDLGLLHDVQPCSTVTISSANGASLTSRQLGSLVVETEGG
ncbi:hypothetical protein JCM5296_003953, partial [Sporobolomyces johnsonii]